MRIEDLIVRGHGLDVDIPLRPLTILLGPNDSGKSTLLAGLAQAFENVRGGEWALVAGDRYHRADGRAAALVVELEGIGVRGHPDERFFGQLLQYGAVWLDTSAPEWPAVDSSSWRAPLEYEISGQSNRVVLPAEPLSSAAISEALLNGVLQSLAETTPGWSHRLWQAWSAILSTCFASRWFWIGHGAASWLCPPLVSVPTDVKRFAEVLLEPSSEDDGRRPVDVLEWIAPREADRWGGLWDEDVTGIPSWIEGLAEDEDRPGETIFAFHSLRRLHLCLWDVVRVTDETDSLQELEHRVEAFINELVAGPQKPHAPRDPWLEKGREGWWRVSPRVVALCEEIGHRATDLAPGFVREPYDVQVEALAPEAWVGAGGRRVELNLSRSFAENDRFELGSVGRGVAIWATYSLIEAMRRIREERGAASLSVEPQDDLVDDFDEEGDREESQTSPHAEDVWAAIDPSFRRTIYIFDEPERHLHLSAQDQVARWIAEEVRGGSAIAVVATHAVPLLQIPSQQADFYWLRRQEDGVSRPVEISTDVSGTISENAAAMGFSTPAEAIGLIRAWLIVEGAHDQKIVERFFSRDLKRARIQILALRGAEGVLQTLELEYLSRLGKPLFLLLDNVHEAWIINPHGSRLVPKREEQLVDQVRRLWSNPDVTLTPLGYPRPDIICSLPAAAVQALLDQRKSGARTQFPGWEELVAAHAATGQEGGFKSFVFKALKLPADRAYADEFLEAVLERSDISDLDPVLRRAMQAMLARLEVESDA